MLWFELKYHFSQVTFKIAALLFFVFGLLSAKTNFGSDELHKNAPYVISTLVGLLSLFSIFVSTLFCANVVLRDHTYKMDSLLFTTGIKRLPYFTIRLSGLILSVFLVLALSVLGLYIAALFQDAAQLGPFKAGYFLQPLFIFALPTVFLVSSILFTMAILTRNVKIIYVSGVLLYVLYLLASILGNSSLIANSALKLGQPDLLTLLADPFGLAPFFGETRLWSVAQRNGQLFELKGAFLLNRLAWSGFALLLLGISYRYFNFRTSAGPETRNKKETKTEFNKVWYRRYNVQFNSSAYYWATFRQQLKLESGSVFKHLPFFLMLLIWAFLMAIEVKDHLFSGFYGMHYYPVTANIIEQLMYVRPAMLLIVFYTAELLFRERSVNMQSLIYSSPAPNFIFWASKATTLGLMVVSIIILNIGIGIATQLFNGHFSIDLPAYLSLFYYSGLPLFLFALLAVFIQTLIPNKYLGMMVNLFIAGLIAFSRSIGIEHYLLRYATVPRMEYSYLNGFGYYASAFNWYMLYWTSFASLLSLLAVSMWQNNRQDHFFERVKSIAKNQTKAGKLAFTFSLLLFLGSGSYICYQTNLVGKYKSSLTQQDWQLRYEKKYKALAQLSQPVIKSVKTKVNLYPGLKKYSVSGSYLLRNESAEPISKIWVSIDPQVNKAHITISNAIKQDHDEEFDQYWVQLKQPLLPGANLSMEFSMEVIRSGFMPFNNENSLVENGSYIELEKYLPSLGYQTGNETDDLIARKTAGLPEIPSKGIPDQQYHLIDYESIISTPADQYVVSVGTLQRSWTTGNRRYFHYKTAKPVNFMLALSSGRYNEIKAQYKGITLNIFYQEGHEYNTAVILQGMKDALDYGNQHFSPYPLKQLSFVEIPQYRGAATAYPGVLFGSEKIMFLSDYRDPDKVNYAYATTVHETAHQWWAHQLSPAPAPGSAFLTESLAKYTETMVLEQHYGKGYLAPYLKADNQLYFTLRNRYKEELPVAESWDQPFVHYQKGGLSLYAIREAIGEEQVNGALRRLLHKHTAPGTRAFSRDLIRELYVDVSNEQKQFIDEQLKKIITYSLKIGTLSCKPLKNGEYSVSLKVYLDKNRLQNSNQIPLAINENFDLAFFDYPAETPDHRPKPFYLKKHHFSQKETTITIVLSKKPVSAGIDPYGYVLDENQMDNTQEFK
ncbi:ABC-2 family transporter protein [Pedobacter caeni]|uniref:ABC-2 family transporter protein n=2 Tax=Pedobacter caeni TaxID=288992 RepID=A0A1M4UNP9_9SPHI|nr:ABC-2 family transporter protein [Pedobacter caeni]